MKATTLILYIICISATAGGSHSFVKQGKISSIEITADTVWSNHQPYCLLIEQDGVQKIRTFTKESIVYIQPVQRQNRKWYRTAIAPLNRVYYTPYSDGFVTSFLHLFIKHDVIKDGYFNAYGANMLVKEWQAAGQLLEEWELPIAKPSVATSDYNISWKNTPGKDTVLILNNGAPFAYYVHRHWTSYGVDSWHVIKTTDAHYRYFIHRLDHTPMAEVRVQDGWKTNVKIITPDSTEYLIKEVPDNKDFMTIAAKLLLVQDEEKKK